MRLIKGLREDEGRKVAAERLVQAFDSINDVAHRAKLSKRAIHALAMGGAFRSLTQHRNVALWNALAAERERGLIAGAAAREESISLPAPTEWEEILRDYRQLKLSTGRHPLALLRPHLRKLGVTSRQELNSVKAGANVCVSGLVTHLQHPQTAKGVIFASLEDETGINNIIIWPGVFRTYRHRILQATLMMVRGELQNQESVVHVVADEIEDLSDWVRRLPRNSRDFH
jgi:error-prone DNA polymerase